MPTFLGTARRMALAPSLDAVTIGKRGFPGADSPSASKLDLVPQTVICGFEWAIEARSMAHVQRRLSVVDPELRGFAYEGATMAYTVRDAFGGHRTRELLLDTGAPHLFVAYIGIGFAMARLPRRLWSKVVPDLGDTKYHPTMSWLAVDGYGFDRAYFDTAKWIDRQYVPAPYPWAGAPHYFPRALDQGIGRALWFMHGARPDGVAGAIARFAPARHADMWSGAGLAASFAGGCDAEGYARLRELSGPHQGHVALGAVLAAKARDYADYVPEYTATAVQVLGGLSVSDASALADEASSAGEVAGPEPSYELWRLGIRAHFDAEARATSK
ncbi:protein of unknown function DUF1702 [Catenulispora acidiphila DSM 44928]|uniref:Enediyne biosynthesis protein n=1 Tax=Catenulispora acidiphila (strain DSM 44928 / JCM 14897 / NBRC 102108 / NRRL B-24433 / ID139908) TaxID=479433 RepID=C7PWE7_CATAD|nr:DUF1702 family protein [Catenulispora acidiphila]ACU75227.1 protein of unknown function DUF1702 [Catenulispora acidiphila DSM 44928]